MTVMMRTLAMMLRLRTLAMMLRMLCKMRKIGDADETREAASLCTGAEILFRVTSRLLSYQRLE